MAQDGFNKVQRKSRKAFKPIPLSQKLSDREEVLQKTGFLNEFDATWEQSREGVPTDLAPTRLVCLALGSFQQSWQTQHQLLLLCHLVQMLDISPANVSVADPVFEPEDLEHLKGLGFQASKSSEGLLDASQEPTLFYLPHAPRWLCERLLVENADSLNSGKACILGNDFSHYDSYIKKKDQEEIPAILRMSKSAKVLPIPHSVNKEDQLYEAFHALALQWVPFGKSDTPSEESVAALTEATSKLSTD